MQADERGPVYEAGKRPAQQIFSKVIRPGASPKQFLIDVDARQQGKDFRPVLELLGYDSTV